MLGLDSSLLFVCLHLAFRSLILALRSAGIFSSQLLRFWDGDNGNYYEASSPRPVPFADLHLVVDGVRLSRVAPHALIIALHIT